MLIGNPGYPVKVDELRGISQMAGIQDKEEIDRCKTALKEQKEDIVRLEARIVKANVELYDKINEDIYECNQSISFWTEELNHYKYLFDKFNFAKDIIDNDSNAENYELIYTKS